MFKIGVDIVKIDRIEKAILRNDNFKNKIFSKKEIDYCESKIKKFESYAARFAAKEAYFKTGGIAEYNEIEILNSENGKPELYIKNIKINGDISLSHDGDYAIAYLILFENE